MNKRVVAASALAAIGGFALYRLLQGLQNGGSNRGEGWTTADMPDLNGKVAIVTGANSGIGYETAVALAEKGATVIMACRSWERGEAARERLLAGAPGAHVELMQLDLASLDSVRRFAAAFNARYQRLDILVNNAGIMMVPYSTTEDGFELQLGTNHLGHFALTGLLLERILATPGARVVNVSSTGHRRGQMDFDNLMYAGGEGYGRTEAYGRSKLANLLFTYELQRRFEAARVDAQALAAHPGGADTKLADHLLDGWAIKPWAMRLKPLFTQSAAMGALPTLRAAVDPQARGGSYYGPGGFLEYQGFPVVVRSSTASYDRATARKLWEVSEELTGVRYDELGMAVTAENT